jgi:cytochrome b involved in lipid metabolism
MATQQQAQLKSLTKDEVAKVSCPSSVLYPYLLLQHNKEGDLWVIVDSIVYDLSKFANLHPGGVGVLLDEEVGESAQHLFRIS